MISEQITPEMIEAAAMALRAVSKFSVWEV